MIERGEYVLRDLGFYDVRVRHHALGNQTPASSPGSQVPGLPAGVTVGSGLKPTDFGFNMHLARIEVGPAELPRLLEPGIAARVAEALKQIGYAHVTVDLQGYRRGSLNGTVDLRKAAAPRPVGQS